MKKIFILFAAALTIGLTGCQSFLEEETYGSTTEIFKEENGIKALVYWYTRATPRSTTSTAATDSGR